MKNYPKENPIPDLISDEIYRLLCHHLLLDEIKLRNYYIRKKYQKLRSEKMKPYDTIDVLLKEFSYLGELSLKKIVSTVL